MIYTEANIQKRICLAGNCFTDYACRHLKAVEIGNVEAADELWEKMVGVWGVINAMKDWAIPDNATPELKKRLIDLAQNAMDILDCLCPQCTIPCGCGDEENGATETAFEYILPVIF